MTDLDLIVESPCTDNCRLNEENVCLGCFRSLEEMDRWNRASSQERLAIVRNASQRQRAK